VVVESCILIGIAAWALVATLHHHPGTFAITHG